MKFLKMSILALCSIVFFSSAKAQDDNIGDVDLSFLAGQTKFNIEYNYDKMMVGDQDEATYKKEKMAKLDAKQPGKGDRWAEKWVNARQLVYEPMFEELINKFIYKANSSVAAKKQADAKYSIVVRTIMTDPGFNAVVMKKNPKCEFEVKWVEIATGKVKASATFKAAGVLMGGSDWDFDPTGSIKECYAKAGKLVGKRMEKFLK
jgi:hypothetical protein